MRRRHVFLALAVGGAALCGEALRPAASLPQEPRPALPALRANYRAADRIQLVQGPHMLWLERRGQIWAVSQAGGYPVLPDKAASLVDGLLALELNHPVDGRPEELGVAGPSTPTGAGTLVRVLAVSGTVLAAIILGPADGPAYVRRPGEPTAWLAEPHVTASTNPLDWTGTRLPPPDLAGAGSNAATLPRALADLQFNEVRASLQVRPTPLRSIHVELADGPADLAIGSLQGQDWLQISGSSAWARKYAPFAFALTPGSLLGHE